jgi:hypothetical protein
MTGEADKHRFTLVLGGVSEITPELASTLYEATGGDIELSMSQGAAYLEFNRAASSLRQAVSSAIREVEGAGVGARVVRVEPETATTVQPPDLWRRYLLALDEVTDRLERITKALTAASVPYALVGGQAVALWVATKDPAAVRTTKDVDLLLRREDLPRARAAALTVNLEYFEVAGVGMFLERTNPNPRRAVHLLWAGEKVRPEYPLPSPTIDQRQALGPGKDVVSLPCLVRMKLMSNRDQDRVHLRDLIDVGLVGRDLLQGLPAELAERLDALLTELGR